MGILLPGSASAPPTLEFSNSLEELRNLATKSVRQFPGFSTSFEGAETLVDLVDKITMFIETYRHALNTSNRTIKAALTTLYDVRRYAMDKLKQIEREYASASQE